MSRAIRVLHIGDVHLGVELYGRPDPEKGYGTRVGDFLAALDRALERAAEADLVLFPGDIYKNCDPTPTLQREFARRVRAVARTTPIVLIPGNHDTSNTFARASSVDIFHVLEVENVYVLRKPMVQAVPTRAGEIIIAALPFLPRSRLLATEEARGKTLPELIELLRGKLINIIESGLVPEVEAYRREHGDTIPAVLMAHYTIQGAVFGGYGRGGTLAPEVDLPLSAVRKEAFDYVALAHIHRHQTVPANDFSGQPPVVYPGSIERVDFSEEDEEKVAILATVSRGRTTWEKIPLHPRPFVTLRVEADEAAPLESVKAAIERKREALRGAVVRLFYTLPAGLPALPERELRAALDGAHYIAAIRREVPRTDEARQRHGGLTTQLGPLEALEEYLRTQPQLAPRREALIERAKPLIEQVLHAAEP